MSINIRNVSREITPDGPHTYEITINGQSITHFTHLRERGLAACLEEASKAAERARLADVVRQIEAFFRSRP